MYDTATRVRLVKKSIRRKQRIRERHLLYGLSALCLFLSVSLAGVIGTVAGYGHAAALECVKTGTTFFSLFHLLIHILS